jgi:hypothetical protein
VEVSLRPTWLASLLRYVLSETGETIDYLAPVAFIDDFLGAAIDTTSRWSVRDTGAATEAIAVSQVSGAAGLVLDATNEVQLAGLDWANQRPLILNQKLMIEFRFRFTVLPTGAVVAVLGLCTDHNAAVNTVASSIWFRADGSGLITVETDDTVHETTQVATGVTLVANQWVIGRIECEDPAAVRFFLDGVRVAAGTTFNMNQVPTLALQPVMRIGKEAAAATIGTLQVDYVKIWQKRS